MSDTDYMWDYGNPYKWMEKIRIGLSGRIDDHLRANAPHECADSI